MIEDSPYRCVRCGKRMHQTVDQDDISNRPLVRHECWSCGHAFEERRRAAGGPVSSGAEYIVGANRPERLRNA